MRRYLLPNYKEMAFGSNPSWLHSVWLGCVVSVFNLPLILIECVVVPFWNAIKIMLSGLFMWVFATVVVLATHPLAGLLGRMSVAPEPEVKEE